MPDGQAHVATPYVYHWRAASIVGGIHPQIIFLAEAGLQRKDPVGTLLVGTALVRPERRLRGAFLPGDRMSIVSPASDIQIGGALVGVSYAEERHGVKLIVDGQ